jgi:hypothetical protein
MRASGPVAYASVCIPWLLSDNELKEKVAAENFVFNLQGLRYFKFSTRRI